jgi:Uma2 family endonuclease
MIAVTMSFAQRIHRYTYRQYTELENESSTKHEFFDGEIYAMAGGSEEHSALAAETLRLLGNAIGERPCRVHTSDLRIYVEGAGLATFPDGSVICGPLEQHAESPKSTATNPTVLLEVTSDSSEEYDTTTKLDCYRRIPSLQDYIIVSHRERRVTIHSRGKDGTWTAYAALTGGRVRVSTLGVDLEVAQVYRGSSVQDP